MGTRHFTKDGPARCHEDGREHGHSTSRATGSSEVLCIARRDSRGELEQVQFIFGHVSEQTTERYIGCKQRLREAENDRLRIEPGSDPTPAARSVCDFTATRLVFHLLVSDCGDYA